MFSVRKLSVLLKRRCETTAVVEKGDTIFLVKDSGLYKTFIRAKNGEEYWSREFYCLQKATKDFSERVEVRMFIEKLCS